MNLDEVIPAWQEAIWVDTEAHLPNPPESPKNPRWCRVRDTSELFVWDPFKKQWSRFVGNETCYTTINGYNSAILRPYTYGVEKVIPVETSKSKLKSSIKSWFVGIFNKSKFKKRLERSDK